MAYGFGFDACKAQVAYFFLGINISRLDPYSTTGGDDWPPMGAPLKPTPPIVESIAGELAVIIAPTIDLVINVEVEMLSNDF